MSNIRGQGPIERVGYVLEATFKHGAGVRHLRTRDDIDHFVTELLNAGPDYRAATVYAIDESNHADPTHELVVAVNPGRGVGGVRYAGERGEFYSRGQSVNPDGPVVYAFYGTGHEFPADSEVPLAVVRQVMWALLEGEGERPSGVAWQGGATQE